MYLPSNVAKGCEVKGWKGEKRQVRPAVVAQHLRVNVLRVARVIRHIPHKA